MNTTPVLINGIDFSEAAFVYYDEEKKSLQFYGLPAPKLEPLPPDTVLSRTYYTWEDEKPRKVFTVSGKPGDYIPDYEYKFYNKGLRSMMACGVSYFADSLKKAMTAEAELLCNELHPEDQRNTVTVEFTLSAFCK